MSYDRITDALRDAGMRVMESATSARSQGPAHRSRGLTLSLKVDPDGPVLMHCFAGCNTEDVLAELGLALTDLYDDHAVLRPWAPPRPRRPPSPWDLIPDPEHLCDRILQQEAIDAGPPFPQPAETRFSADQSAVEAAFAELDAAWALHVRRLAAPEYGVGGGDGYGEWSPERKAAFAEFRAEVDAREGQ